MTFDREGRKLTDSPK
jgi:hypothetical protein